mmetsp:Transcript_15676/g.21989  ORF Transcript_15676/g.21989 Transcript_15676/m.21989 type:complete len:158 (+) Transcript_15676:237-710(+)
MQAAGQNATKLFQNAHAYVNAKATLKPYILGKIRGGRNYVDSPLPAADTSTGTTTAVDASNEDSLSSCCSSTCSCYSNGEDGCLDADDENKEGYSTRCSGISNNKNVTDRRSRCFSVSQLAYDAFKNETQRSALESIGKSCTGLLKLFAKDFEENML